MKMRLSMAAVFILACTLGGCYIYTDDPPQPVIIIPSGDTRVITREKAPQPPPAPSGAPAGAIGPPR